MTKEMRSREDIINWMQSMLADNDSYNGNTGSAYDNDIRILEDFSRPLWGIFSIIASGDNSMDVQKYIDRIKQGINSNSPMHFKKATTKTRQIAVEMAVYGFGLAYCGKGLLKHFDLIEIEQLANWLNSINEIEIPEGNWLFFVVLVNEGLKKNNLNYSEEKLQLALDKIETFYLGDGWYSDGPGEQRDYYIPFALHFYGLLYSMLLPKGKEKQKYQDRASEFTKDFIYWFDGEGRALPFGRSLTYRFAHVAFWSAMAVTNNQVYPLEVIKGVIMRNLNWWKDQPMYTEKGHLSIGYSYPNLIMTEDYNSPGSPMWAFKAFIILLLPDNHEFWKVEAAPYPILECYRSNQIHAGFLVEQDHNGTNSYALAGRQFSKGKIMHNSEKYGKFCYSTYFGWNLTRDQDDIKNCACDSALALSIKGTNQFFTRSEINEHKQTNDYILSVWNYGDIATIKSYLIPIDYKWHIRIHKIETKYELESYEGGFPVFEWNPKFISPEIKENSIALNNEFGKTAIIDLLDNRKPEIVLQNPNTNIYNCEGNAIGALYGDLDIGLNLFGCLVYGTKNEVIDEIPKIYIGQSTILIEYKGKETKLILER